MWNVNFHFKFSPERTKVLHFSSSGLIFLSRIAETSFSCLRPPWEEFKWPLARGQQPLQEELVIVSIEQVAQYYGQRWMKHLQYYHVLWCMNVCFCFHDFSWLFTMVYCRPLSFIGVDYTVSAVKTETSEQKNVSNIYFFSENILFNTIEYI